MSKRWIPFLLAGLLSGCYAAQGGADFSYLGIRTIAVMPILNETQEPAPERDVYQAMAYQLGHDKHFLVLSPARTLPALQGDPAYSQLLEAQNLGRPVPSALLSTLATDLNVDALMFETLTLDTRRLEAMSWPGGSGGIGAAQVPVTLVGLSARLWSARSRSYVWHHDYLASTRTTLDREGNPDIRAVIARATQGLLATFPTNPQAPESPAAPAS